jgi:hypothetical protein
MLQREFNWIVDGWFPLYPAHPAPSGYSTVKYCTPCVQRAQQVCFASLMLHDEYAALWRLRDATRSRRVSDPSHGSEVGSEWDNSGALTDFGICIVSVPIPYLY